MQSVKFGATSIFEFPYPEGEERTQMVNKLPDSVKAVQETRDLAVRLESSDRSTLLTANDLAKSVKALIDGNVDSFTLTYQR